jgi:hypothetical protein
MLHRRELLGRFSAGAGSLAAASLLRKIAAQAAGNAPPPRRVLFFLFDNGWCESPLDLKGGSLPEGVSLVQPELVRMPLADKKLPFDIEPFTPFKDRVTLLQGIRSHGQVDHGGYYFALSGALGNKLIANAQSIDAALAEALPGVFPLVPLGAGGSDGVVYNASAWGAGRPIGLQCSPQQAYMSLFGQPGSTQNVYASRKRLFNFLSADIRGLHKTIAGPERDLLEAHFEALDTLSRRDARMEEEFDKGTLAKHAPKMGDKPAASFLEKVSAQCDIAAAAFVAGLTNVVTIAAGHYLVGGNYSGISSTAPHGLGHNTGGDPALNMKHGFDVLAMYHNKCAEQVARLLTTLKSVPEGNGTMFDNTLVVFTSDSANQQHAKSSANWPFALVGNLGGRLASGQFLSYPVAAGTAEEGAPCPMGRAHEKNPVINALYCTLLHAIGKPRETFNRSPASKDPKAAFGPLAELLA